LDISSLIAKKANAPHVECERLKIGLGIIAGRSVFLEQRLSDDVDLSVGTLSRKDGGHQELQGIGEPKFTMSLRISRSKALYQGTDPLLPGRRRLAGHDSKFSAKTARVNHRLPSLSRSRLDFYGLAPS
jgi:hypothetical protein